jgi:hypothetical protein
MATPTNTPEIGLKLRSGKIVSPRPSLTTTPTKQSGKSIKPDTSPPIVSNKLALLSSRESACSNGDPQASPVKKLVTSEIAVVSSLVVPPSTGKQEGAPIAKLTGAVVSSISKVVGYPLRTFLANLPSVGSLAFPTGQTEPSTPSLFSPSPIDPQHKMQKSIVANLQHAFQMHASNVDPEIKPLQKDEAPQGGLPTPSIKSDEFDVGDLLVAENDVLRNELHELKSVNYKLLNHVNTLQAQITNLQNKSVQAQPKDAGGNHPTGAPLGSTIHNNPTFEEKPTKPLNVPKIPTSTPVTCKPKVGIDASIQAHVQSTLPTSVPITSNTTGMLDDVTLGRLAQCMLKQLIPQFTAPINPPARVTSHMEHTKFKVQLTAKVHGINLKGGEWLNPEGVLRWVTSACRLDVVVIDAVNRTPQSTHEWREYFRFYLMHFEGGLKVEMSRYLDEHFVTSTTEFWLVVFDKVFPPDLVQSVFRQALDSYPMWADPVDLNRWEDVTRMLLTYMEMCDGKDGVELIHAVQKGLYQQIIKVLNACPSKEGKDLMVQFAPYQAPILRAQKAKTSISTEQFENAYSQFMDWLKPWVARHGYQGVFGYSQAKIVGNLDKKVSFQPDVSVRQMSTSLPSPPPIPDLSFANVVQHGSQDLSIRQMHTSAAATKPSYQRTQSSDAEELAEFAPTGIKRTWTWLQKTKPARPNPRQPCNGPPPPECTDPRIQYLGDWLDMKGNCSYCTKAGHAKAECRAYAASLKLSVEYNRRKAAGLPWPPTKEELSALTATPSATNVSSNLSQAA